MARVDGRPCSICLSKEQTSTLSTWCVLIAWNQSQEGRRYIPSARPNHRRGGSILPSVRTDHTRGGGIYPA
eukprot:3168541-Pyramimonas_sp.AAC.1